MLFLQGSEVIFKVALSLLGSHKPLILQHDSLESIVDFIKTTLPNLGLVQMEKTINQVRDESALHPTSSRTVVCCLNVQRRKQTCQLLRWSVRQSARGSKESEQVRMRHLRSVCGTFAVEHRRCW